MHAEADDSQHVAECSEAISMCRWQRKVAALPAEVCCRVPVATSFGIIQCCVNGDNSRVTRSATCDWSRPSLEPLSSTDGGCHCFPHYRADRPEFRPMFACLCAVKTVGIGSVLAVYAIVHHHLTGGGKQLRHRKLSARGPGAHCTHCNNVRDQPQFFTPEKVTPEN